MILDTNILIAYLNGESKIVETISHWKRSGRVLFISSFIRNLPLVTRDRRFRKIREITVVEI